MKTRFPLLALAFAAAFTSCTKENAPAEAPAMREVTLSVEVAEPAGTRVGYTANEDTYKFAWTSTDKLLVLYYDESADGLTGQAVFTIDQLNGKQATFSGSLPATVEDVLIVYSSKDIDDPGYGLGYFDVSFYGTTITDDDVTTTDEVVKKSITEKYLCGEEEIKEVVGPTSDYSGKPYTMSTPEIYGYTYKETIDGTSTYLDHDVVIKHMYTKNSGEVTDNVTKDAPKTMDDVTKAFNYDIYYNADVLDYVGSATLIIKDTPQYKIDLSKDNNFDGGSYDETTNTITWTVDNIEIGENNTKIAFEKHISLFFIKDNITTGITNTVKSELKYGDETSTDEYTTPETPVDKGYVVVNYVDENNDKLADSITMDEDLVGKNYTTESKDIYGYTLKETPKNANGQIAKGKTEVNYIYTKNKGEITDENTSKEALDTTVDSINSAFKYTLSYSAKIDNYVGNSTTELIDYLPYAIDTSKSNLDGGVYDENTKTIKWSIDTQINESNKVIDIVKNIELYYLGVTEGIVKNDFKVETKYDSEISKTNDDAKTTIKEGKVIVHYVDVDGNSIDEDEILTGLVGTTYTTTQKEYGEYYLEDVEGITDGKFTSETIEVTYIYDLSGVGDIEPPQTGFDTLEYISLITSRVLIAGFIVLSIKKCKKIA